jgi:hypothetical protein
VHEPARVRRLWPPWMPNRPGLYRYSDRFSTHSGGLLHSTRIVRKRQLELGARNHNTRPGSPLTGAAGVGRAQG